MVKLEHANLIVRDVDEAIRFLSSAFPTFRIRGEGKNWHGDRWVHFGDEATYVALNEASTDPAEKWIPYCGKPGLNHLGYEVDNADGVRARLREAGFKDSTYPNNHPYRKRVYFYDADGNDWEFVEYLSVDPAQRNDYDLPDES